MPRFGDFESAELERDVMGRGFDRPYSDADSDAHAVGKFRTAIHAKKIEMPSKVRRSAMDEQERIVGERADGLSKS